MTRNQEFFGFVLFVSLTVIGNDHHWGFWSYLFAFLAGMCADMLGSRNPLP